MNTTGTLTFALDALTSTLRHVRELQHTGQACGCICPGCRAPLEAVNALNPLPKNRPHFRHITLEETSACRSSMLKRLLQEVLRAGTPVTLPIRPFPGGLFAAKEEIATAEPIAEMIVRDATSALLRFPDGREYRVQVIVTDTRTPKSEERKFDLILDLRGSGLDSKTCSVDKLRDYLTLDSSAWRWCRFQTTPALIPTVTPSPDLRSKNGLTEPLLLDDDVLQPAALTTRVVEENPNAIKNVQAFDPKVPIRVWDERSELVDGRILIVRRKLWRDGIMTEESHWLPRGSDS